jgi:hypothetical protein
MQTEEEASSTMDPHSICIQGTKLLLCDILTAKAHTAMQ